jgi:hypothetical protein
LAAGFSSTSLEHAVSGALNAACAGSATDTPSLPAPKPLGEDAEPTAARRQIEANFESEFQSLKGVKHSAWAAYNAVSQYVDHERPLRKGSVLAKSERRFENVLLGGGAELKRKAWQEALLLTRN